MLNLTILSDSGGIWHLYVKFLFLLKDRSYATLNSCSHFLSLIDKRFPESTAVLEDYSRELGSAQWDKSKCLEAPLFKPEGSFDDLISSCHPLSVNNEISHAIQHADYASENYCYFPSNHSPNWLSLSTPDSDTSLMDLDENSFASLMTGNFDHQQLQNNVSNCKAPSGNAKGEGLLCSPYADFGNSFYSDDDQEKDFMQMRGKILFQTGAKEPESDVDNMPSLYMLQNEGTGEILVSQ